jgi:hypothetical protein
MKIISNDKLINRYSTLGKYLNIAALVVLFGGMALTYFRADLFYVALIALFTGFILSQVSVFFINRWGRVPRPDQQITSSLKGLTNDYTLYHYNTPVSHLLVGPSGVWVLLPYYQRGTITYEKNKWKQKGGGIGLAYLKIFAQEGIGRPDLDVKSDVEKITSFLTKTLASEIPPVSSALIFTDKRADVQADNAPIPTLTADKLKELIRRQAKENPYPIDLLGKIKNILPQEEKNSKKQD